MVVAEQLTTEKLAPRIHEALRAWHNTETSGETLLDDLLIVRQRWQEKSDLRQASPTTLRLATNEVLFEAIEELAEQDAIGAQVLRLRFADDNTLMMVAHKQNVSEHTVSRIQRAAIGRLAEIVADHELAAREGRSQAIEAQLPPSSYNQLFGFTDFSQQLMEKLLADTGPAVVAIIGIGGIGKTALADRLARQMARDLRFEGVIWVRSEPQTMSGQVEAPEQAYQILLSELADQLSVGDPADPFDQRLVLVRQKLKGQPFLVIIDNLETDSETAYLLDQFNDLAEPTKFLLTSRTRPPAQATVYHFTLGELPQEESAALLHHHAQDLGIEMLDKADDKSFRDIYDVTGGNPLALKLVVSQLDLIPLNQILAGLRKSRKGPIEELYRHIYWQSWQILSSEAKSLLQAMPLVSESGGSPDYLQSISGLAADRFWPALQELRTRSLLEVRGTLQEKRYGVHRLTETFLRTEIIQWVDE